MNTLRIKRKDLSRLITETIKSALKKMVLKEHKGGKITFDHPMEVGEIKVEAEVERTYPRNPNEPPDGGGAKILSITLDGEAIGLEELVNKENQLIVSYGDKNPRLITARRLLNTLEDVASEKFADGSYDSDDYDKLDY